MKFGDYRIEIIPDTEFRLDGGAMFGVVPRVVWERVCPPDEKNRILLNMNCIFIDTGKEKVLIETGIGEKWDEKHIEMYGIRRKRPFAESLRAIAGCGPEDIDIVINTHLHFDHAGGNTVTAIAVDPLQKPAREQGLDRDVEQLSADDDILQKPARGQGLDRDVEQLLADDDILQKPAREQGLNIQLKNDGMVSPRAFAFIPQFPNARYLVSKNEFDHAQTPHERDRASYLPENWEPVQNSGQLELMRDDYEPIPGLKLQTVRGHSETMQTWRLDRDANTMYGFADLIPTRHHISPAWIAGYDLFPTETLEFKKRIIPQAINEKWLCLFYHDIETPLGRLIGIDGKTLAVPVA